MAAFGAEDERLGRWGAVTVTLKLPRIGNLAGAIVDKDGRPTRAFVTFWDTVMRKIEVQENTQDELIAAIQAAQDAADAADAAAAAAQASADAADAAAISAQTTADEVDAAASLNSSFPTGLTISATDAGSDVTITISGHTCNYGNGTNVAVTGGTVTGQAYSTALWIYYDQPSRAGGAVTYLATNVYANAFPTGANPDRHFVGAVTTPAALAAPSAGVPRRPPGYEEP